MCQEIFSLKEHIIPSFIKDGRALVMARVDFSIIRQMEQPFDNIRTKLLVVASWQISAPDTAAEKCIASEDPAFNYSIETDAANGMTWCADDLKSALSHLDDFTILQVDIGQLAFTYEGHSEHRSLLPRANKVVSHVGMCCHFDAIFLLHSSVAQDMINVAMRIDNHQRLEVMAIDEAEKFIFLACIGTARIDDNTFLSVLVINDVGVFRKGIEDELFEF